MRFLFQNVKNKEGWSDELVHPVPSLTHWIDMLGGSYQ